MSDEKALQPAEQKTVLFYDDEITAVRLADGRVFIPVRPLVERLGIDWNGQRRRINRDAVLSEEVTSVDVTSTQGDVEQRRAMVCLPLDYISGFLFGINADRVNPDVRDQLIRYQKECYKVLAEAFQDGRLTTDADLDIEALLAQDSPAAQAYQMAMAVVRMARQQLLMEARLAEYGGQLQEHGTRLDQLEAAVGGEHVTEAQAQQISQAVKAIAMAIGKKTKRNEFGAVYGELYRTFNCASYRSIPQRRFGEVMKFLNEWLQNVSSELF